MEKYIHKDGMFLMYLSKVAAEGAFDDSSNFCFMCPSSVSGQGSFCFFFTVKVSQASCSVIYCQKQSASSYWWIILMGAALMGCQPRGVYGVLQTFQPDRTKLSNCTQPSMSNHSTTGTGD